ncbi:MAG: hypothetical protein AAGF11_56685, partial [Myxococcota bacterium]
MSRRSYIRHDLSKVAEFGCFQAVFTHVTLRKHAISAPISLTSKRFVDLRENAHDHSGQAALGKLGSVEIQA